MTDRESNYFTFDVHDFLKEWKRADQKQIPKSQRYLLEFEPSKEDLEFLPFLDGLGGLLQEFRHPFLISICKFYNCMQIARSVQLTFMQKLADGKFNSEDEPSVCKIIENSAAEYNFYKLLFIQIAKDKTFMNRFKTGGDLFDYESLVKYDPIFTESQSDKKY